MACLPIRVLMRCRLNILFSSRGLIQSSDIVSSTHGVILALGSAT